MPESFDAPDEPIIMGENGVIDSMAEQDEVAERFFAAIHRDYAAMYHDEEAGARVEESARIVWERIREPGVRFNPFIILGQAKARLMQDALMQLDEMNAMPFKSPRRRRK